MIRILLLTAALAGTIAIDRDVPKLPQAADVLVIYHGYNGTVETAGILDQFQYTGAHMMVEFHEGGDGIFNNGFEGQ